MSSPPASPAYKESTLLFTLAAIQFTHIMDFMIMMPLGPQFMRVFGISPAQFGYLVSSYSFSAGLLGFLAGFVMDRFDRKRALLFLYAGFSVGTLACALAPNYEMLLLARIVAGGFGGVASSVVYAIVADVIPFARRGKAMGVVMTSFSVASILGLPVGLSLANLWGWHAPFVLLVVMSVIISIVARRAMPALPPHAHHAQQDMWVQMSSILAHPNHHRAFILVITLTAAGALIFPFMTPSMVMNAGMPEKLLPLVYIVGGATTFLTASYIGRLSDRIGKLRVFLWLVALSAIPTLVITNMVPVPVWVVIAVMTVYMVISSGRNIPSMALVSASVEARYRGGFMSVNSAMQQIAAAVATFGGSLLLGRDASGRITGFPLVGAISLVLLTASVFLARRLRLAPENDPAAAAKTEPFIETAV